MTPPSKAGTPQESLASVPEGQLLERLLSDVQWRSRILGLRGIPPDVVALRRLPLKGLPGERAGDVDVLLVPPDDPSQATAIEAKRLKVADSAFLHGTPNKLLRLEKGVRQANLLAQIGFFQVYYFIFVVVDSRSNNKGRFTYEGLTRSLSQTVESAIASLRVEERVGIVHFELVQPMDDGPLGAGTYSANPRRLASPSTQSTEVTEWVRSKLSERRA